MRQRAHRDGGQQFRRGVGGVDLHRVLAAQGNEGQRAARGLGEREVVGDEAGLDHALDLQRVGVDAGHLAHVLVRHPHFLEVRGELQEGGEGADHRDALDHLARGHVDHVHLRREAVHDEGDVFLRMEQHHARPSRGFDAADFLEGGGVDHGHVVLAAHDCPHLLAVWREERFVRRAADVGDAFDLVGTSVDEGNRIGAVGNRDQGLVVGREVQAVHVELALVQRRQHVRPHVA